MWSINASARARECSALVGWIVGGRTASCRRPCSRKHLARSTVARNISCWTSSAIEANCSEAAVDAASASRLACRVSPNSMLDASSDTDVAGTVGHSDDGTAAESRAAGTTLCMPAATCMRECLPCVPTAGGVEWAPAEGAPMRRASASAAFRCFSASRYRLRLRQAYACMTLTCMGRANRYRELFPC